MLVRQWHVSRATQTLHVVRTPLFGGKWHVSRTPKTSERFHTTLNEFLPLPARSELIAGSENLSSVRLKLKWKLFHFLEAKIIKSPR